MTLAPTDEADRRLYVHTDLGLRIETPPPFLLDPLPNNPRLTAGVQVTAAGAPPPYAAPNEPLCLVGFKNADDPSRTQEGLNEDASVDRALAVQTRAAEANSLAVDRTSVTDYRGSKLIELFQTPRAGAPGWSDSEFYVAMFERPSGAYAITCVAAKGRMAEALPTFQTIRDGAGMIEAASAPPR
ncbi:hypothetical protein [Chenggangzhangella methanolivorans]|uniref:Uncharacterized protein n=2 Tax=Chenggangzhangella methanolivorans TaxID=1437009 RepID=A0A9E6R7B8_9HYPH|nr:hypothetical protein [Chenggangzhangella methanolivorans]QZN99323.1 hypothetical protein K6K41_21460 [Chenggangzhangella methanolivorans]